MVPVTGKTSILTSWVVVALASEAKNFAVVVPRLVVAVGVQENSPVDVAQVAPKGSTDENESTSSSGSSARTLNSNFVPSVVEAVVGPEKIGGWFTGVGVGVGVGFGGQFWELV